MNRRVPKLILGFSLEDFGFFPAPAEHTSEEPGSIRVDSLLHLDGLIPTKLLQVWIFGPYVCWALIHSKTLVLLFAL